MDELFKEIQENSNKLQSCEYHQFVDITPERTFAKKYQCKNCKGTLGAINKCWYEKGLQHGINKFRKGK